MRSAVGVLALTLVVLLTAGCASAIAGQAVPARTVTVGADPSFIVGTDGGDDDRLVAATLRDLERYWGETLPTLPGGRPFRPLRGYYSVDSSRPGLPPPCTRGTDEIEGNAFYCPRTDTLAYDRAALIPVLRSDFGDAAAVVVIAHEYGHAIQERVGPAGSGGLDGDVPTILSEGQADCYSAAFLRRVRDGGTALLRTGSQGVDAAMAALTTFRDPVGTGADDDDAHGNAFDRVTSFQIGYEGGASACAGMSTANRVFTQSTFTSLRDEATGGNLPLDQLVRALSGDLDRFYRGVVTARGGTWTAPGLAPGEATCDRGGDETQGPAAFCPVEGSAGEVRFDVGRPLRELHEGIGDYATGTLLASRYGLAALAALGRPVDGPDAGHDALCLAGAYTGSVTTPQGDFSLSPGDLDEAVTLLLRTDDASRDTAGTSADGTGYARIADFREGVDGGAARCLG